MFTNDSLIVEVQMEVSYIYADSLDQKLSSICATMDKKNSVNKAIKEREYQFVNGYRIKTWNREFSRMIQITLRDEFSLIQKGRLELIPFYGFDIGEPTSVMRGYDVQGPLERFSFRPNARVAGVVLYSQFVKVDENGIIKSMHLVTNPHREKDSEDLIAYFSKNSIRTKKKQSEIAKNIFRFVNGYTIEVLEKNNNLYHFMITKSHKSNN